MAISVSPKAVGIACEWSGRKNRDMIYTTGDPHGGATSYLIDGI